MTVAELLSRMSGQELTEWAVYEDLTGPLDQARRGDIQAGIVAATIANANRGKKGKRFKPQDFVPNYGPKPVLTWQEQLEAVVSINRALGGEDRRAK
jgi:hypothetical protein